jgi:protein TonB
MKKIISLFILLYSFIYIHAQHVDSTKINYSDKTQEELTDKVVDNNNQKQLEEVFFVCEENPIFKDGDIEGLKKFIYKNLIYPAYEKEAEITGRVLIRFVIEKDGSVSNIEVLKKVSPGIDREAIRLVSLTSGMWIAGKVYNKPVRSYFNIPVNFSLN